MQCLRVLALVYYTATQLERWSAGWPQAPAGDRPGRPALAAAGASTRWQLSRRPVPCYGAQGDFKSGSELQIAVTQATSGRRGHGGTCRGSAAGAALELPEAKPPDLAGAGAAHGDLAMAPGPGAGSKFKFPRSHAGSGRAGPPASS